MNPSNRISFHILLIAEIACVALLAAGVIMMCSPFWLSGGLLGWWDGYNPQEDVLGIVWLTGSLLSIFLGMLVIAIAAVLGISVGISAGIVGLATHRTGSDTVDITAEAIDDTGSGKPAPPIKRVGSVPNQETRSEVGPEGLEPPTKGL